jgi:ATP-dependent exoDNAse (exonuclease V) beta subunit
MPIISGLGGGVTVTDDVLPLYEQATNELYELLGDASERGDALRQLLLSMDNNWQRCSELLVTLLGRRADWIKELGQHENPDRAAGQLSVTLERVIQERLSEALKVVDAGWLCDIQKQAQNAHQRLIRYVQGSIVDASKVTLLDDDDVSLTSNTSDIANWQWLVRWLLTADNAPRKRLDKNGGFQPKIDQDAKDQVLGLIGELEHQPNWQRVLIEIAALPRPDLDDGEWQGVLRLSRVLPVLAAQLLTVFRARGAVDHAHVAMAAETALGSDEMPTDLALRLDYQISHILIDEFQDTSQGQFRLIEKLCRGWAEHNYIDKDSPRTLFIVGDAMQSIYGFRYADVGLFLLAREEGIANVLMESRDLSRNFRSQAGVIDWVNGQFDTLIPGEGESRLGVVPMTHALPTRERLSGNAVEIHNFPDDSRLEARYVGDRIEAILELEPESSVAVLARTRAALEPISEVLRERSIDIVGTDLTSFSRRASVSDLMSLTSWLANPADTVALASVLRAPMIGLTLMDLGVLVPLLAEQSLASIRAGLGTSSEGVSDDGIVRAKTAFDALLWGDSKRDRLNLVSWVEQVWRRLGGDLTTPSDELSDVDAFFTQLRDQETRGLGLNIEPLNKWHSSKYAAHESASARVELMTLHKSKGLEFDHVFIVGAGRTGRSSQRPLLRWNRDERLGLLIAARPEKNTGGALYDYLSFINKCKEDQELIRLYYVGVTRAKRSCTVTATCSSEASWPPKASRSFWSQFCEVATEVTYHPAADIPLSSTPERPLQTLARVKKPINMTQPGDVTSETVSAPVYSDLRQGNLASRRYGTVLHRGLELLSHHRDLPESCPPDVFNALRFQLRAQTGHSVRLENELQRLVSDINRVLADKIGRWVLSADHSDAHSELTLYVPREDREVIIDRTFIESETQTRWVIDYKTSHPEEGIEIARFLEQETTKYQRQLQDYRSALVEYDLSANSGVKHCKMALYFPTLGLFQEVLL